MIVLAWRARMIFDERDQRVTQFAEIFVQLRRRHVLVEREPAQPAARFVHVRDHHIVRRRGVWIGRSGVTSRPVLQSHRQHERRGKTLPAIVARFAPTRRAVFVTRAAVRAISRIIRIARLIVTPSNQSLATGERGLRRTENLLLRIALFSAEPETARWKAEFRRESPAQVRAPLHRLAVESRFRTVGDSPLQPDDFQDFHELAAPRSAQQPEPCPTRATVVKHFAECESIIGSAEPSQTWDRGSFNSRPCEMAMSSSTRSTICSTT